MITTTGANALLDAALSGPVTVGLYKSDMTEISATDYGRKAVEFTPADGGQAINTTDVSWSMAKSDWGTVANIVIFCGGKAYFVQALTNPQTVSAGNTFVLPAAYIIARFANIYGGEIK